MQMPPSLQHSFFLDSLEDGRASGTGWWLPTHSTASYSDSLAERSLSSGCAGLDVAKASIIAGT